MIATEVQYRATVNHLRQFEEALRNLKAKYPAATRTKRAQLEIDAVQAQADDLSAEIDEYERLRSGEVEVLQGKSLVDLATLLVKARVARGWTQRQLAEALGIAEQQVQRYEATGYRSASLARISDVADALSLTITEEAHLPGPDAA
ncbi:MAG: helix-turn-helix domain-containing protein [Acidimicrobiales bacterium]